MLCNFCSRKLANSNYEKKTFNTLIFERNYLKRLIFYGVYNKNEEHKYSRSEFYYPEENRET